MLGREMLGLAFLTVSCWNAGCSGSSVCDNVSWRVSDPQIIACRGSPTCSCSTGSVCCIPMNGDIPGKASCTAADSCGGVMLTCDGPEDCASGEMCCGQMAAGGGSSCKKTNECSATGISIFCHSSSDCPEGLHCLPGGTGSFFEGIAGYCTY